MLRAQAHLFALHLRARTPQVSCVHCAKQLNHFENLQILFCVMMHMQLASYHVHVTLCTTDDY